MFLPHARPFAARAPRPERSSFRTLVPMFAAIATIAIAVPMSRAESEDRPNIVVIFCDDLGYGDFSCYGHPTIRTPNVDRMAAEGLRFTQFYSAAPVCTPSRAALLTGRLPIRNGLVGGKRRVLFHDSKRGLPADEITIAEVLQGAGYATACVGKWHLGHLPPYLPGAHGFDTYFGIPYSNDMDRTAAAPEGRAAFLDPKIAYWNVPLMRQDSIIERPADQTTITRRYTEEAVAFIRKNASKPFFLYLAHSMPHVPLFRSPEFENRSPRGLFGDVVEEVDWSVGAVLDALRAEGLSEKTLVLLTSDNGPWTTFGVNGGSAGLLRGGKGSTWEGGMREPAVAWWPGRIPAGRVTAELACTTDLFATVHGLLKIPLPDDRPLDSHDITPVLTGAGPSPRRDVFYYRDSTLMAVRRGPWKMHLITQAGYGQPEPVEHAPPLLFHLEHDPGESHNVAERHPEVIDELRARIAEHRAGWTPPPSLLDD